MSGGLVETEVYLKVTIKDGFKVDKQGVAEYVERNLEYVYYDVKVEPIEAPSK